MDISAWLEELGLGEHAECFRTAAIGVEELSSLTAEHLKELGIPPAHRFKLLKAISRVVSPAATILPESTRPRANRAEAERRHLTVVFVDLTGSTALSGKLDPEEMQDLLRNFQNAVSGEISRHGGYIAKLMGDGIMAYFGWPRALEDAAERAVRAGLTVASAVAQMRSLDGGPLAARVGIASGIVVIGGEAGPDEVVGQTPNLAARLQGAGRPGEVVVSEGTRLLLNANFRVEQIELGPLKGFEPSILTFRVTAETGNLSRYEAHLFATHSPMIGRDHELALMRDRWDRAVSGEGQGVLLTGEAGIGKSRLAHAFVEGALQGGATIVSFQCSPDQVDSALWPVARQMASLVFPATVSTQEDKLKLLADAFGSRASPVELALFAELLGLDARERWPLPSLTPPQKRQRLLSAIVEDIVAISNRSPVVALFEDLHWCDPTTLEFIEALASHSSTTRVMLVMTARPDLISRLGVHTHIAHLALSRLGRASADALISQIASLRVLDRKVAAAIVERADGVPLFVEELTKSVLESEAGVHAVPGTLQDSLMARLDRQPLAKEVAQYAACIGRDFNLPLLLSISDLDSRQIAEGLEALQRTELVFTRGATGGTGFVFKHALVRDVAYASLLKKRRIAIHRRIVSELLTEEAPGTSRPELLARHCIEGELFSEAVGYLELAGDRSLDGSAMIEAAAHYGNAAAVVARLAEDSGRDELEAALQAKRAHALALAYGYTSVESGAAYRLAVEIARRRGLSGRLRSSLYGLFVFHLNRGEMSEASALAMEQVQAAEVCGEVQGHVIAQRAMGTVSMWKGEMAAARGHQENALKLFEEQRERESPGAFQHDVEVSIYSNLAWIELITGHPDNANRASKAALAAASKLNHTTSLAVALHRSCLFHELQRDLERVEVQLSELRSIAERHKLPFYQIFCEAFAGVLASERAQHELAVKLCRRGVEIANSTGLVLLMPYLWGVVANVTLKAGDEKTAQSQVAGALAQCESTGERWYEAELRRISAVINIRAERFEQGVLEFAAARTLARNQGALWWELRICNSHARHLLKSGDKSAINVMLAPIRTAFGSAGLLPDLVDADDLLSAV